MAKKTKTFSSGICILNDGETFQPTIGTIVVEFDAGTHRNARLDDGDPRGIYEEVANGEREGRILNVYALIRLYDAVKAANIMPMNSTGISSQLVDAVEA